MQEELRVTPTGVQPAGELFFQFADGYSLHGYVFTATGCVGEPQETDEANEQAYTELVEFVRVGAQLLFDELARFRGPSQAPGAPTPGGQALH